MWISGFNIDNITVISVDKVCSILCIRYIYSYKVISPKFAVKTIYCKVNNLTPYNVVIAMYTDTLNSCKPGAISFYFGSK